MGQYRTCPDCHSNLDSGERCVCRDRHQGQTGRRGGPRTDFGYHINFDLGYPVLVIEDLDQGGMSVTNNLEAVLQTIREEQGGWMISGPIVYRDSDRRYDGVDARRLHVDGGIYAISVDTEAEAVAAALKRAGVKRDAS